MFLPLYLGVLHAVEPDHIAVVTGVSLSGDRRGAWKVGLAFGASHMLAVALLAVAATFLGQAFLGDGFFLWMDRLAWTLVLALGLWNLAAALGLRAIATHSHSHQHGPLTHDHPHPHAHRATRPRTRPAQSAPRRVRGRSKLTCAVQIILLQPLQLSGAERPPAHCLRRAGASMPDRHTNDQVIHGRRLTLLPTRPHPRPAPMHPISGISTHTFHHSAAWLGAFFGLGGVRGFTTLMRNTGSSGQVQFIEALLLFGLGITAMFTLLSAASGWLAGRMGTQARFRRTLYALSGVGNVAVGLYLLFKA